MAQVQILGNVLARVEDLDGWRLVRRTALGEERFEIYHHKHGRWHAAWEIRGSENNALIQVYGRSRKEALAKLETLLIFTCERLAPVERRRLASVAG